jgi:putative transposase
VRNREKLHRLPEAAYRGRKSVAYTACTEDRRRGLDDSVLVEAMVPILQSACHATDCMIPVFCFMPDHLHVVVCGMSDAATPKRTIETFKRDSGMWLAKHRPEIRWQKDYHDRILRRREIAAANRYIALNPVRAGLAKDIHAWPFTGAIGFELQEVFFDAFWD